MGVYKKQPKKKQPFNNQQYSKINILLQAKYIIVFHGFIRCNKVIKDCKILKKQNIY